MQDMHEIFSYYDRDGLGKIDYRKFTNKILIKPKP
jgi:Ca2+-binding EF-hand superfamily protein